MQGRAHQRHGESSAADGSYGRLLPRSWNARAPILHDLVSLGVGSERRSAHQLVELSEKGGSTSEADSQPGLIGFDEGFSHALPSGFDSINFQAVTGNVLITSISGSTIPEPSTWAMMLLGFAWLGYVGFRRTRKVRVA